MPLSLATWNINSVRLRIRLVLRFLKAHPVDVLCLQEIKCQNEQFPAKQFTRAGYPYHAIHGQKGYHGVAIVSRFPLTDISSRVFCEIEDCRHVSATVDWTGGPLTVHSIYIPAGGDEPDPEINPKFRHKLNFLRELKEWFGDDRFRQGQLICGDFNVAPHADDVWSHKQLLRVVSHTPVETQALDELLTANHGWTDLVRKHLPYGQKLSSWWSYRALDWQKADRGRRLDHIWSTADIAANSTGAEIIRPARGWSAKPSDHVPVIAHFRGPNE